jgi:hypothetical protein
VSVLLTGEQPQTAGIITATQHLGHGSPAERIIGALDPKLTAFF